MPNVLGGGDVAGPASATDNAVARFDGTTGKLIQNSVVTISDTTGDIAGAQSLTSPAATNLTLAGGAGNSSIILTPAGTGNVGIGTTTPDRLLDLYKATPSSDITSNAAGYITLSTNLTTIADVYGIQFRDKTNNRNTAGIFAYGDYTNNSNTSLIFATRSTSGDIAERMRIKSNGDTTIASTTAGSSGAGALVVAGGLATGAASYFGGAVTVEKSLNSDLSNFIINTNVGAGAEANLYVSNAGTGATSATLGVMGTGYATVGGFIQDAGVVSSGTGLSGGLSIMARAASSDIRFYAGSHTNLVATFASTGAATFAGAVTVSSAGLSTFGSGSNTVEITPSAAGRVSIKKETGSDAYIELAGNGNTAGTSSLVIGQSGGDLGVIYNRKNAALSFGTNGTERLSISAAGAATFAGAVTVANANGIDINSGGSTAIFTQSISSVRKNFIYFDGTNTTYGADTGAIILSPSSVVQVASGKALKLGNAYVAGAVVGTGSITIQDSTGTTYRIPVLV